ncbi:MAG: tyrosine-type recombinase/integrase [Actinomycetota bacterium]
MAFIRKREHKSGKVTYSVVFRDPRGRRRERAAGPRRKDAEALLRTILTQIAEGSFGKEEREDPTFSEFAEDFLAAKRGEIKPSTLADYRQVIRNHLLPAFSRLRLSEITPARVQAFLASLAEDGVSPATAGKVYRVLKVILRRAIALELLDRDPTVAIRPPRVERKEMDFLTPEEVEALLAAAQGDTRDIIATAVFSGLRQGEIFALRWRDVDFEAGVIRVVRSYSPSNGFTDLKTSSSRRAVPLLPRLAALLRERYERKGRPGPEELVFQTSCGTPFECHNFVARQFLPALKKAGLPRIRFHDLRHTFASLAISCGMDPKALQGIMGHSSITVTMDTYAHLFPGAHERAMRRMEAMFSSGEKVVPLRPQGGGRRPR